MSTTNLNTITPCSTSTWCDGHNEIFPESDNTHLQCFFGELTSFESEICDGRNVTLYDSDGVTGLNIGAQFDADVPLTEVAAFTTRLRRMADELDAMALRATTLAGM